MGASVASCLQKIELWYPSFGLLAIDCDRGCLIYATAASQWRIVEIQFLASLRWKRGCQPFSCRCSQKLLTAQKRFVPHVCPRNPCLLILLWNLSLHSLPEAWGSWERQYAPPALRYGCISCIMLAKDRVVVSKLWITGDWLWWLSYKCDCCKSRKNCRDSAFSVSEMEAGVQTFQLPIFAKVTHCRKEICSTCLSKESMPFDLLWNLSLHSLPEAWVPESGSTFASSALRYGCIMPIPSSQLQKKIFPCDYSKLSF